jgi:hypothetical protein
MHVTVLRGLILGIFASCATLAQGQLVIHYAFDDQVAGTATNSVGTNGAIVGASLYAPSAAVGSRSLAFDGNDDYITTGIDLGSTNQYTMSFWYNTATNQACCSNGALYYTNGGWGAVGDELHSSLTSNSSGVWHEIHSGNQRSSGAVATALNTWNHVVASFDNGNITYTVNGTQSPAGSQTMSGATARLGSGQIGAWNGTRDYNGLFDDWAIWTEALSTAEATAIYNLATSALDYNAQNADDLFGVFDGDNASVAIDGLTWIAAADGTLVGAPGQVLDLGDGAYGVVLNANGGGVRTAVAAAVPEPATLALWTMLGLGLFGYGLRIRRRA